MFPERLKQLRKEKGMTQIDLAKALDISGGTVAMWETGKRKPSFEMFDKLTTLFDRRLDYILGSSDDDSSLIKENESDMLGDWVVQEEYEDVIRKYSILDDDGQRRISETLRTEFSRCVEQGSLKSGTSVSVSVKVRDSQDTVNED